MTVYPVYRYYFPGRRDRRISTSRSPRSTEERAEIESRVSTGYSVLVPSGISTVVRPAPRFLPACSARSRTTIHAVAQGCQSAFAPGDLGGTSPNLRCVRFRRLRGQESAQAHVRVWATASWHTDSSVKRSAGRRASPACMPASYSTGRRAGDRGSADMRAAYDSALRGDPKQPCFPCAGWWPSTRSSTRR
jgi:hypothetical protein